MPRATFRRTLLIRTLFILAPVAVTALANVAEDVCPKLFAMRAATVASGTLSLELPPRMERYLLYAVIEDDRRERYLAVIGYRGRHQHIHLALEVMVSLEEIGVFRYLAMGELLLRNDSERTAPGRLEAVNETAGYFARALALAAEHRNAFAEVLPLLAGAFPWYPAPGLSFTSIDQSRRLRAFHLFPGLDAFIARVEARREEGALSPADNYRHYIGNRVTLAASQSSSLNGEARRRGGRYDRRHLEGLGRLVTDPLTNEALRLYVRWTANDGADVPFSDAVAEGLRRAREAELSPGDWERFARDFDAFVTEAMRTAGAPYLASTVQVVRLPRRAP